MIEMTLEKQVIFGAGIVLSLLIIGIICAYLSFKKEQSK